HASAVLVDAEGVVPGEPGVRRQRAGRAAQLRPTPEQVLGEEGDVDAGVLGGRHGGHGVSLANVSAPDHSQVTMWSVSSGRLGRSGSEGSATSQASTTPRTKPTAPSAQARRRGSAASAGAAAAAVGGVASRVATPSRKWPMARV